MDQNCRTTLSFPKPRYPWGKSRKKVNRGLIGIVSGRPLSDRSKSRSLDAEISFLRIRQEPSIDHSYSSCIESVVDCYCYLCPWCKFDFFVSWPLDQYDDRFSWLQHEINVCKTDFIEYLAIFSKSFHCWLRNAGSSELVFDTHGCELVRQVTPFTARANFCISSDRGYEIPLLCPELVQCLSCCPYVASVMHNRTFLLSLLQVFSFPLLVPEWSCWRDGHPMDIPVLHSKVELVVKWVL